MSYDPVESLREEVHRFKDTNKFNPMTVTNFFVQDLKEAKAVMERSGWYRCPCPGHWKEHGPSCYIGQALTTINKALEGK